MVRVSRRGTASRLVAGNVAWGVVVGRPFPHIAGHVEKPMAVRGEGAYRRTSGKSVRGRVLEREFPLPGIGHPAPARKHVIAPAIGRAVETAACGELPFRLARQPLSRPCRIGAGILISDLHDRIACTTHNARFRPIRMSPARAWNAAPPVVEVAQIDPMAGPLEHDPAWLDQVRGGRGARPGGRRPFRNSDVARLANEARKPRIGHPANVDPEAVDLGGVDRPLFRVGEIGALAKSAPCDPSHARETSFGRAGPGHQFAFGDGAL